MCSEFIIEVLVNPDANQPIPTEEELDELEQILAEAVDTYLNRLSAEMEEEGNEDAETELGDD